MKKRLAVLASGNGSNFQRLVQSEKSGRLGGHSVVVLVCDRAGAVCLDRAAELGIPTVLRVREKGESKESHEQRILEALKPFRVEGFVLAGYLRIFSSTFLNAFRSDQGFIFGLNLHPALLPSFPGLHSYRQALEHGVKIAGVTVHLVDEALDHGPICAQESFEIPENATLEMIESVGKEIEHRLLPETVVWVFREEFEIRGRRCVRTS